MKIFAIRSDMDKSNRDLAYLLYYESEKRFYIELPDEANPWETPLLLSSFLKKGEKTVNSYWSLMWVRQRIIPADRQNLGLVLAENGLEEYDEFELLMLGNGRCAQDDYYLAPITERQLSNIFIERYEKKIEDVVPLRDKQLLVFFRNGKLKKVDVRAIVCDNARFSPIIQEQRLFDNVGIQVGGYGVSWGEQLCIADEVLYRHGIEVPLSLEDFRSYVTKRVVNTAEAIELLACTRQNMNDLVKRGKLTPIKQNQKNTLFLKSEILQRKWM